MLCAKTSTLFLLTTVKTSTKSIGNFCRYFLLPYLLSNTTFVFLMDYKNQCQHQFNLLFQLHSWERKNLPISRTTAGYHLILFLSRTIVCKNESVSLKNIYHSLPFSEKTLRLLLRELESEGLIEMSDKSHDQRYRDIVATHKLHMIFDLWFSQINLLFR